MLGQRMPDPVCHRLSWELSSCPEQYKIEFLDIPLLFVLYAEDRDLLPTRERANGLIASLVPNAGYGNTLPVILLDSPTDRVTLLANLNSFALDYLALQKVQGQHVNWFIVEQLPVVPPADYDLRFGPMTARELIVREVLHLTYTAHDMAAFARDVGHVDDGDEVLPPFAGDEAERRQRRARLDALYFHPYGLARDAADYILLTFPIVRRHDEEAQTVVSSPAISSWDTWPRSPPETAMPSLRNARPHAVGRKPLIKLH
jgi:hypothetical protein